MTLSDHQSSPACVVQMVGDREVMDSYPEIGSSHLIPRFQLYLTASSCGFAVDTTVCAEGARTEDTR